MMKIISNFLRKLNDKLFFWFFRHRLFIHSLYCIGYSCGRRRRYVACFFTFRHKLNKNHHVCCYGSDKTFQEHKIHLKETKSREHERLVKKFKREIFNYGVDFIIIKVLFNVVKNKSDVANLLQTHFTWS